jgi:membrane-associated phospholipid phosphatase
MKYSIIAFAIVASVLAAQTPVEPLAGQWKTFVIATGATLRVQAPPDEYTTNGELDQVRQLTAARDAAAWTDIKFWNAGAPSYRWMEIAWQEVTAHNIAPTLGTRAMALVAAAMYDATVAAWDSKYAYNRPRPAELDPSISAAVTAPNTPGYPSEYSATAAAAAGVLSYLFPDSADRYAQMATRAANSRLAAGVEFPTDSAAGAQIGQMVGQAVAAYAKADKSDSAFSGSFPPAPGKWSSTSPVTPLAGTWQTWVLSSASQFRPGPPPATDSTDGAAQVAAVKGLNRTTAVSHTAWFWQPSFTAPWLDTLYQREFEYGLDADAPRAARAFALTMIAQHDATLACWDAKYTYLEPRPSMVDSTITTLFPNPQHPGYPSGHACASGGMAAVLGYLFPDEAQFFNDRAQEAGTSTFDAGIHTQLDVSTGLSLGQQVGAAVVARASQDGSQ